MAFSNRLAAQANSSSSSGNASSSGSNSGSGTEASTRRLRCLVVDAVASNRQILLKVSRVGGWSLTQLLLAPDGSEDGCVSSSAGLVRWLTDVLLARAHGPADSYPPDS